MLSKTILFYKVLTYTGEATWSEEQYQYNNHDEEECSSSKSRANNNCKVNRINIYKTAIAPFHLTSKTGALVLKALKDIFITLKATRVSSRINGQVEYNSFVSKKYFLSHSYTDITLLLFVVFKLFNLNLNDVLR